MQCKSIHICTQCTHNHKHTKDVLNNNHIYSRFVHLSSVCSTCTMIICIHHLLFFLDFCALFMLKYEILFDSAQVRKCWFVCWYYLQVLERKGGNNAHQIPMIQESTSKENVQVSDELCIHCDCFNAHSHCIPAMHIISVFTWWASNVQSICIRLHSCVQSFETN